MCGNGDGRDVESDPVAAKERALRVLEVEDQALTYTRSSESTIAIPTSTICFKLLCRKGPFNFGYKF